MLCSIFFYYLSIQMNQQDKNALDKLSAKAYIDLSIQIIQLNEAEFTYFLSKPTHHIQHLNVGGKQILSIRILQMKQNNWENLIYLRLTDNLIGNMGCKHIIKMVLPKLQTLYLTNNKIDNIGVHHLIKGQWMHLKKLGIGHNSLSNNSVEIINKLKSKMNIQCLYLHANLLTLFDIKCLILSQFVKLKEYSNNNNQLLSQQVEKQLRPIFQQKYPNMERIS